MTEESKKIWEGIFDRLPKYLEFAERRDKERVEQIAALVPDFQHESDREEYLADRAYRNMPTAQDVRNMISYLKEVELAQADCPPSGVGARAGGDMRAWWDTAEYGVLVALLEGMPLQTMRVEFSSNGGDLVLSFTARSADPV